jgi:hypothetical protein
MVDVNVSAADTEAEARRLFTSVHLANMSRSARGRLPPPIGDVESYWMPLDKARASTDAVVLRRRVAPSQCRTRARLGGSE